MNDRKIIYLDDAIDALCDNCDNVQAVCPHYPCKQYIAIENLPPAQQDLIDKIQNGINATNANDSYSCGMRNGMRWCMSLVDDKEPSFEECPSAQPEPEELDFVQPHKKIGVRLEIGQPDRSLWFRIGEICVDESKRFISAGRAVEKIRELLREAERQEE